MTAPRDHAQFVLISGNRLERLAAFLGERLAQPLPDDTLAPDTVLIPQPTLKRWLQQTLALRHGIAANLDFVTPSEWVWRLLRAHRPDLPEHSPWERERLRWRLYALLGARDLPVPVRAHLQRAADGHAQEGALARWRLAEALAGAFDRYQAYRRDWLQRWERGDDADDWQAGLWRRLVAGSHGVPHRAALIGDWLARHDGTGAAPPGLPPRLSAFGTIHVSPDVLRMLGVAAQTVPLDFYLPTPCAEYWGDVESLRERLRHEGPEGLPAALADWQQDNPLLAAWGAAGRDISAQLFAYDAVTPAQELDLSAEPESDHLLARLQRDVLRRRAPQTAPLDEDDASIQIHACHSRLREVEVLHDRLRALLDADETLAPRDIAVLAPDIGDYLPLVRAVFGGLPPGDPRYIPYSLADRPQAQVHPLAGLFLGLLALPASRFTASELLDLLNVPAVARALELDAAAHERIARWFEDAGIRWGEDEDARVRAGVGRWREHSIAFGFDRLLLGYALGADALVGDVAAYPELEGQDAQLLDRIEAVFQRLRALAAWMRDPHPAREWQQRLAQDFIALLAPWPEDEAEAQARRVVLDALDAFAEEAEDAGDLPAALVQAALAEQLEQPSPHQAFLAGGVTFAGMVPLRTVPFRVICLLGMDAEAYPRREAGGDVNRLVDALQGRAPRRLGDRSVRDDDRFLFLQLLCAAGDVFYLSYGGRDARDGSVREPSALVSELLDVAQRYLPDGIDARERLLIEHPLQPFSPQAFGAGDPRRFSYRGEWLSAHAQPAAQAEAPWLPAVLPAREIEPPDRDALQRFFAHPPRAFLRERMGLYFPREAAQQRDREPLGAEGLTRYQAVEALLEDLRRDADELRARGLLPPGSEGEALALQAGAIATQVAEQRAAALGAQPLRAVESRTGIAFRFDDVAGSTRVLATAGKLDGKRRLRAGIDHLLLATQLGDEARTVLIGYDAQANKGEGEVMRLMLGGIDAAQARARLDVLLALLHEGDRAPLPFLPKTSCAYADALRDKGDAFAAWQSAYGKQYAPYGLRGEGDDLWVRLAFRPDGLFAAFDAPLALRFREIAQAVFDACEPEILP